MSDILRPLIDIAARDVDTPLSEPGEQQSLAPRSMSRSVKRSSALSTG